MSDNKEPSEERGCALKADLGSQYKKQADKFSLKWGKQFAVYACPHCGGKHMTTKIDKIADYALPVLYITPGGS